ncbi:MAG: patatin-like phospholipase family protein [Cellulosilyticaceae bacterium]
MGISEKKIGLALSGGGMRAAVFHMGLLKWLAEENLLENVKEISTVSGASICIALVYAKNNGKWPTSKEYLEEVLPKIKDTILKNNIQKKVIKKMFVLPQYWSSRVKLLGKTMEKEWGITGGMNELPKSPMWNINCTTYETGKVFKFSQEKMGDYKIGFTENNKMKLAEMVAASAGVPILIGGYKIKLDEYEWKNTYTNDKFQNQFDKHKCVHLMDGGVYDNLGLEPIYDMNDGGKCKKDIDYIIVSNAVRDIRLVKQGELFTRMKRLLDITMNQVSGLRSRNVVSFMKGGNGLYLKIGNTKKDIYSKSGNEHNFIDGECLSDEDAEKAKNYAITLSSPTEKDFEILVTHGYEVAKYTYAVHKDED